MNAQKVYPNTGYENESASEQAGEGEYYPKIGNVSEELIRILSKNHNPCPICGGGDFSKTGLILHNRECHPTKYMRGRWSKKE